VVGEIYPEMGFRRSQREKRGAGSSATDHKQLLGTIPSGQIGELVPEKEHIKHKSNIYEPPEGIEQAQSEDEDATDQIEAQVMRTKNCSRVSFITNTEQLKKVLKSKTKEDLRVHFEEPPKPTSTTRSASKKPKKKNEALEPPRKKIRHTSRVLKKTEKRAISPLQAVAAPKSTATGKRKAKKPIKPPRFPGLRKITLPELGEHIACLYEASSKVMHLYGKLLEQRREEDGVEGLASVQFLSSCKASYGRFVQEDFEKVEIEKWSCDKVFEGDKPDEDDEHEDTTRKRRK